MHILILPKWYPGRNDPQLGEFIRNHAIAVGRSCEVSVLFVHPHNENVTDVTAEDGIWEMRSFYRPSKISFLPLRKMVNLIKHQRTTRKALKRLVAERGLPDLCHVHILVRPIFLALWMRERFQIPFIISEQSSEYVDGTWAKKGFLFKAFNRWLFKKASATTVVSPWLNDAMRDLDIPGKRLVVPNVLPLEKMQVPERGAPNEALMVADLVDATKNISGVLRALAVCIARGNHTNLNIIGDGPDREKLHGLVVSLGLQDHVTFLGRLANSEVLSVMARTGYVIINSNVETFSVVTGEALVLGKPVIATRCGGPQAFITNETGLLVDPKDDDALALAMDKMRSIHHEYDPARIRASVEERFSYNAIGAQFHGLYKAVLNAT